ARTLGYHLSAEQLQNVFERFKVLADKKKDIYDGDLASLCEELYHDVPADELVGESWQFVSYNISTGTGMKPTVTLRLKRGEDEIREQMICGDGPVDAIFLAIEKITGVDVVCRDFRVQAVTVGKDAQGEVNVEIEHNGQVYRGRGVSTDSVEASGKAFLNAINRVAVRTGPRLHPQHSIA
ncbi:MAG TPA: alpha-isopropylmalate synthase regulatory domain-containing protein, partial [Pirellulales bacterium]|nr:alpha-isopropylmalate synthase regulatory domain-containing protein [Pirellulales bacterium]